MDRRTFFRKSMGKLAEAGVKEVERKVISRAGHWIRPPFALGELEFLMTCTRCGGCVEACPQEVIFPLASRLGAQVVNTPAMDLLNKGCLCCQDWPCVNACEPRALHMPEPSSQDQAYWPRIARIEIDINLCLPYIGPECGACNGSCPVPGALNWEGEKPVIDVEHCTGCACCREACIVDPKAIRVSSSYKEPE